MGRESSICPKRIQDDWWRTSSQKGSTEWNRLQSLAQDELILRWKQYEAYVQALEDKYTDLNSNDVTGLRESEEKLKQQQ